MNPSRTRKWPPASVTLICALFFASGLGATIYHGGELVHGLNGELLAIFGIRIVAMVGAVFAWRGSGWARWVLLGWIAAHVLLSGLHHVGELVAHAVLMIVVVLSLFNRRADTHFQSGGD